MREKALGFVRADRRRFVKRAFIKVLAMYSPLRTPLGTGTLVENDGRVELKNYRMFPFFYLCVPHALLVLGGTACFCVFRPRLDVQAKIFVVKTAALCASITAVHAITFGETRFRLPLDLAFMLFTAMYLSGRFQRVAEA
ncbi:MAG: hypothetical protein KBA51_06780 [Kiritimatiellae bacterium]|nr:hypothetical protein [Kiritimatiellia bacterium]